MTDTPKTVVHSVKGAALTGSEVHTVNLTGNPKHVTVINTHASLEITFTVGEYGGTAPTPTAAGDDFNVLPAGAALKVSSDGGINQIKLISSGAATYIIAGR